MKEQIRKEVMKVYDQEASVDEVVDKLLVLFGVSTRTFQIGDKVKWRGMDLIVVEVGINEVLIATSENVDDKDYNDWWVRNEYVC